LPLAARAQQPGLPVVGLVYLGSADASTGFAAAFRKGLGGTGHVDGQNVTVEYHWPEGQSDRLAALMADLVRRRVAVIATFGVVSASRPKLLQRRSPSCSASVTTRSSWGCQRSFPTPAGSRRSPATSPLAGD